MVRRENSFYSVFAANEFAAFFAAYFYGFYDRSTIA